MVHETSFVGSSAHHKSARDLFGTPIHRVPVDAAVRRFEYFDRKARSLGKHTELAVHDDHPTGISMALTADVGARDPLVRLFAIDRPEW